MNVSKHFLPLVVDENLVLKLIDESHAEPLLSLVSQNRDHLRKWLPWVDYMRIVADFDEYIRQCKENHEAGTEYGYVILQNGALIGRIGIHYIQKQNRTGAIGYWLGKESEGKGVITKACCKLIDHCFSVLKLNRIEIKCSVGNDRSAAIPERLGFTKEGVLRQAEWLKDGFIDLTLYSLLKEEWNSGPDDSPAE